MICAKFAKRYASFELELELIAEAGVTVLFGASGAGKTLTLDCLAGFVAPEQGRILLDDELLFDAAADVNLSPRRRNCGYVFQDHALFPHMTVRGNLLFAAERHARLERHRRVGEMMDRFRIAEFAGIYPHELSGGQKQRCSLARALVTEPRFLLLDEPARGLDLPLRNELYQLVRQIRSEYRIPILVVTHDLEECFALADTMVVMGAGKLLQSGAPSVVYRNPASFDVARMLGIANQFEAEILALDPGRDTSRVRMLGREFAAAYLPGYLLGDKVRLCVPASQLNVAREAGRNCVNARVAAVTELPSGVRVQFEPELIVEMSRETFDAHGSQLDWWIEIPASHLRATG